jgi:hypothetical protein
MTMQAMGPLAVSEQHELADPVESYFECITTCDINDGVCVDQCVLVHLKQGEEGGG